MQSVVDKNTSQVQNNTKPVVAPTPFIQKKLEIGASDDAYEIEADRVADKVMNGSHAMVLPNTGASNNIQRKCSDCEKEEQRIQKKSISAQISPVIQRKCTKCEEERIQKKPIASDISPIVQRATDGASGQSIAPNSVSESISNSQGSGQPLQSDTRSFMESRFGSDFSNVRVHSDSRAASLSQQLNAKAFTVGNDIYFNQGQYQPNSYSGKHLLAHELTHTIQQSGFDGIQTVRKKANKRIQRGVLSAIGDAASWTWDHSGGAVIRAGGRVIEWTIDKAEEIIEDIAPGLLDFLRRGWESLRGMLGNAVDAMTGGLFSQLQQEGLSGVLSEFVDSIILSLNGGVESACRAFKVLAEKIFNFIERLTGGALERIRQKFIDVRDKLSFFWNHIGKPAIEAVKTFAREVWDWVVDKAEWLWDLIEPIRSGIRRAWNWIMDKFDLAWEAGSSILDWLSEKLSEAWDWIMEFIEPIKKPLMAIGMIILLVSPLGPFVAVGAIAYGVYRAAMWIKDNWDSEVFVRFREYIKTNILDPLAEGLEELKNLAQEAFQWLSDSFESLKQEVRNLMAAIGQITIFRLIRQGFERLGELIASAASAVQEKISEFFTFLGQVISDIWTEIRPYVVFVGKLIIVAMNPWAIPIIIAAWYWRILPDCYKPPVINFVLRMMITVLSAMPNFRNFGDYWFQIKTQILQFLQETLNKSDEEKVIIVNRVAKMISELDLEFLSNMVEAVLGMPGEFEGQMEEELLGVDLTNPLPFERTEDSTLQDRFESLDLEQGVSDQDARLFSMENFTEDDIAVDEVALFDPNADLMQDIMNRVNNEGDTYEFGEPANPEGRDVQTILNEIVNSAGGLPGGDPGEGGADTGGELVDFSQMSEAEEIEYRLQQMMAQSDANMAEAACTPPEQIPQNDGASAYPEHLKFGPLTRGQRARYSMGQMWSGLGKWWRCNRHWLLPTLIGILAVLIIAELLSGGWVTAALPIILEALIPLMIGVAAVRSAYYIGEYGYKAIAGDVVGASKALARSIAVVAVEVIFTLLGSSAFWRSVKGGAGATARVAQRAGGALTRAVPGLGRVTGAASRGLRLAGRTALRTGRAAVSRGRLIMRGVGQRVGRSARSLQELAEGLFRRVRFRRFRIRLINGWFRIEGYINPWVLLATGEVRHFDQSRLRTAGNSLDDTVRLGDEVFIDGTRSRGIVVGSVGSNTNDLTKASQYVQDLASPATSNAARIREFRKLRGQAGNRLSRADRLRFIRNAETTAELRRGIRTSGVPMPPHFQAHHIIPRELRSEFGEFFRRIGFNIEDGARNGIMVPPDASVLQQAINDFPNLNINQHFGNSAFHLGSHPDYTDIIRTRLTNIDSLLTSGVIDESTAMTRVSNLISDARNAISSGGGQPINSLVF